ncbi:ADA regulatory protein / Methylated-DNA--protein-cysteine methyltransferase [hydrothermal vent metagenome]|uniref:methylated-DNA--[protein]-cysteine S-methyltransferase n=1 Tax=hydrothermal vent metagenome TaxID=652676 RepID=A0A3B0ZUT6_9ZZZZ
MSDYDRIAKAIKYINASVDKQPSLNDIAQHLHLSSFHFQRLFSRWVGVTPKKYLQILTVERAKQLLDESISLSDVTVSLGLSSGSRLYHHFVKLEAMTPGDYQHQGDNLIIEYEEHDTPFGKAFIALTARGICSLFFLEFSNMDEQLIQLKKKWPAATYHKNYERTLTIITEIFNRDSKLDRPLSLNVNGTNFQISVWKALLAIPVGKVVSYSQVARAIGRPSSARAVGTAIGANPAAFIIPCHRVIQQTGQLGGYHWGLERLHAIHAWETVGLE